MAIKSVDYIVTAKHYGNGSARGYIRNMQQKIHRERGVAVTIKNLDQAPAGAPVTARIWQGQWIADCECNSASFVDPDEPIFMCFGCGNRANGSRPRPVSFPPENERKEIERLLLERPVDDLAGLTDLERAGMAKAVLLVEVEDEVILQPSMLDHIKSMEATGLPAPNVKTRYLPLTRSWEPGETVEDLHKQQDEPIRKWKRELKEGKAKNHGVQ